LQSPCNIVTVIHIMAINIRNQRIEAAVERVRRRRNLVSRAAAAVVLLEEAIQADKTPKHPKATGRKGIAS
jgi:hypothetical protein